MRGSRHPKNGLPRGRHPRTVGASRARASPWARPNAALTGQGTSRTAADIPLHGSTPRSAPLRSLRCRLPDCGRSATAQLLVGRIEIEQMTELLLLGPQVCDVLVVR